MNEKVKQIFDILGVEPEEEFKIKGWDEKYKFDTFLQLFYMNTFNNNWQKSLNTIGDVICRGIKKNPQKSKLTNKDKIAIKFLKNCGFHYVVKSEINTSLFAFENMPDKIMTVDGNTIWAANGVNRYFSADTFDTPIYITKPLCLDDFTDEDLKED